MALPAPFTTTSRIVVPSTRSGALSFSGASRTIDQEVRTKYGINGSDLVTVGYGKSKPKYPNAPMDPINRRVQVVNLDTKTASK